MLLKFIFTIFILISTSHTALAAFGWENRGEASPTIPGMRGTVGGGKCNSSYELVEKPPYYSGKTYTINVQYLGDCKDKRGDVGLWVDVIGKGIEQISIAQLPLSKQWNMGQLKVTFPENGKWYGISTTVFPGGKMAFGTSGGTTINVLPDPEKQKPGPRTPPPAAPKVEPKQETPAPKQPETAQPTEAPKTLEIQTSPPPAPTQTYFVKQIQPPVDISSLGELIVLIIRWMLMIIAVLAILFIMIGGFIMVTSSGKQENITRGKTIVKFAIIGFVLSLSAFTVVSILQALLGVK